jgi:hypothetical protein
MLFTQVDRGNIRYLRGRPARYVTEAAAKLHVSMARTQASPKQQCLGVRVMYLAQHSQPFVTRPARLEYVAVSERAHTTQDFTTIGNDLQRGNCRDGSLDLEN